MDILEPKTGIVVIGRNEGERLIDCLRSIGALGKPIVYVDSASNDGSQEAALTAGARLIELDPSQPFTASRARHEGAAAILLHHPSLQYIQFIDGDCVLVSEWIEIAEAFLDHNTRYAIVCGRRLERDPGLSPYNRLADLEWNTPIGEAAACGGDSLVRAEAYLQVGGFDRSLVAGEEPELCSRLTVLGWKIYRIDADMTHHDAAIRFLMQYWKRAIRSGYGYAQAWHLTCKRSKPLFQRELIRAFLWTLPLPLGIATATITAHLYLIIPVLLLYLVQATRLAAQTGISNRFSWQRSGLLILSKAGEAWGVMRYALRRLMRTTGDTIVYK